MLVEDLVESLGEPLLLALVGAGVGLLFGVAAQRSRFCMRAAVAEAAEARPGPRMAVWLVAFAVAVAGTQGAIAAGVFTTAEVRQIAATGSLSGAIIGGLMFGAGMILARGCASRLLILSSTGNLRALVAGLVLTIVAQASLRGVLSPAREALSALWTVPGGPGRDVVALLGLSPGLMAALALAAALGIVVVLRREVGLAPMLWGAVVGVAVAAGWAGTALVAHASFEIVPIGSVTFTGPSADTLMGLVDMRTLPLSFATGLVPGVAAGAFLAALATRELKIERFGPDTPMERYLVGAVLMGFGAMLAGGCAVGATVTGGSVMAVTAWVAGGAMWLGAIVTARLMAGAGPQAAGVKA